jgi:hypothetical protein
MPKGRTRNAEGTTKRRGRMVGVKLTEREFAEIQADANRYGLTVSEFIRIMACIKVHAQDIGEQLSRLQALAGGGPLTDAEAQPLWQLGKLARDALSVVQEGEEQLRVLKALLVPGLLEIKRVIEERGLIPTGEPKAE